MLTWLKVSGFKNLVDVDVRFGGFTCVAGADGVGKSNLFDAIRFLSAIAAGNPRGNQRLRLPNINKLEQLPDPKEILHGLLYEASGLTGRRLKQFSVHERVHRVSELIDDFSPLRALSAFQALEADIQQIIQEQGWCFTDRE
ncbi:hypothetical protein NIES2101_00925 [Calothrix sp. HK-06]|nr:hypothetical protein NIES2101_00925 [Calothrix sp. HK-06]